MTKKINVIVSIDIDIDTIINGFELISKIFDDYTEKCNLTESDIFIERITFLQGCILNDKK